MLSKKALTELLKKLHYSDADIAEMTGTTEVDLKPLEAEIFSKADLETLKENVKKGTKESALDIKAKELKAKYGIDDSTKDIDRILEIHAEKKMKESNVDPDGKLKEYDERFKKLQKTIDEKEQEVMTIKQTLKDKEVYEQYKSVLHPDRNPALTDDEWIMRLKNHYEIAEENGVLGVKDKATGKFMTDKKENVIPAKDALNSVFTSKPEWMKPAQAEAQTQQGIRATLAPKKGANTTGKGLNEDQIIARVQEELGTLKGAAAKQRYNELVAANTVTV
jgi:hypothetical protein